MAKTPKTPTDDQYGEAWREFESGKVKIGLWAKLYVDNEGDDKKTKAAYLKQRALSEKNDQLYERVWKEVESDVKDEGLWARLFAENEGDEKKTKIGYLTERVQRLHDAHRREREEEKRRADARRKLEESVDEDNWRRWELEADRQDDEDEERKRKSWSPRPGVDVGLNDARPAEADERRVWRDGELLKGKAYDKDGNVIRGVWRDGEVWNATAYDKDGNVISTYSNGIQTLVNKQ